MLSLGSDSLARMSGGSGIVGGGLADEALGVGLIERGGELFDMVSV